MLSTFIFILLILLLICLYAVICGLITDLYEEKNVETSVSSIFFGYFPLVHLYVFFKYIFIPNKSSLNEVEQKLKNNKYKY